jgi:pyruvate ferredoxin oxidoreductase delta subunit
VLDKSKCTSCLLCWIYCPDNSVIVIDGTVEGFDYEHCKGCGICAEVCPDRNKAIEMVLETQ